MMSFKFSGGVEVLGFISPTEPTDEYPVIDPLYGIDGFRNVDTLTDLNLIPDLRRRAGMVVGVSGGTQYYKLNQGPWNGTISDWTIFNSGGGGIFTGGTITGNTIFTSGVTANTFSTTTIGTSGDCVDDIYVSNIHSCSPLNINPLDEGNVYFGSTSGVTFDLTNKKVGIGTSTPSTIFHVVGNYTGGTDALIPQMLFQNINTIPNTNKTAIIRTTVGTGYVAGGYPEIWLESQQTSTGVGLTKLRTVSNHPLLFYTNDLERMRLNEVGNFGINTPSPAGKLHVRTGVNKNIIFTSGATGNQIRSLVDGNAAYTGLDLDSLNLNLKTNGLDRVVVDSSGNVGIGTSLPQETLHISGTSRFDNDVTIWDDGVFNGNSRKLYFRGLGQTGNTQTGQIFLDAYGNTNGEILELRSGGGVRLGATGIDGTIQVYNFASNNPVIQSVQSGGLGLNVNSTTNGFTFTQGYTQTTGDLFSIYNSGPTKAFSILASNSNVGIGNITPSEKLDVSGKTKTTNLQVTSGATAGYVLTAIDSSGNAKWEALGSTSNELDPVLTVIGTTASTVNIGDRFLISGGTGIWSGRTNQIAEYTGVTPTDYSYYIPVIDDVVFVTDTLTTYRFDGTNWIAWRGTAILQNGNSLATSVNIGSNNNQNLTFRTSGQTRVTISASTGNVGIGTTTPQARLHVAGTNLMSAATQNVLTVIGSGNTNSFPIFSVQGSQGELFSVTDSLTGSLFSVNDISGLPVVEVFSDDTILMGSFDAPSLNTTTRVFATTGTTNVYSIPTSAYTGAFFDYTVSDGTNLRAGNIMSVWSGSSVNYTETQTTDFGNTSGLTFNMVVSSGNAILRTSGTTGNWTVKTIVRSI